MFLEYYQIHHLIILHLPLRFLIQIKIIQYLDYVILNLNMYQLSQPITMHPYYLLTIVVFKQRINPHSSVISQYCTYTGYYYWYDDSTSIKQTHSQFYGVAAEFQKGIGFWMNYRPLESESLARKNFLQHLENSQALYNENFDQVFVFSYSSDNTGVPSIYFYIDVVHDNKIINHNILVQTQTGWQKNVKSIPYEVYEGDWIFLYCYMDNLNQVISIYSYSSNLDYHYDSTINGQILIDSVMLSVTGGYKNIQIDSEPTLYLQSYPGVILGVFTTTENVFNNFEQFLFDCSNSYPCTSSSQLMFVPYNYDLTGDNVIHKQYHSNFEKNRFILQGWIKQDVLQKQIDLVSILLRVTVNLQYFDNYQIGDRALYILYYQSKIYSTQNGFSLQTYSYTFPYKPAEYNSDSTDTILILGEQYQNLITKWHYFMYEIGTLTNNQQPIYRVRFPSINVEEQYVWNKPINHFSSNYYYFHIGGDDYFANFFRGSLSNWAFSYFCDEESPQFEPLCDYSCLTCRGISSTDCLSCLDGSYRIFIPEQNVCSCQIDYIDIQNDPYCQDISQYKGIFSLTNFEIVCDQIGYYQCDINYQICDFGYFSYNNGCIQWYYFIYGSPHYDESKSRLIFLCSNCYFYPDQFSSNPTCITSFFASDESSVYIIQDRYYNRDEVYTIKNNVDQKGEMQMQHGFYSFDGSYCKSGFFMDSDHLCKACMEGCFVCVSFDICRQCYFGYSYREEGICVPCKMCHACEYKNGEELCYYPDNCKPQQYWENRKCIDCGQYCASCVSGQCFYCTDAEQYYITLDNVNCIRCPIEHCKYCFEYIQSSDPLITTLDWRTNGVNLLNMQVKIGCALCSTNYFFSFITFQCELSPSDMLDCDFGIITDEIGTAICIKSQTRLDSIQSSYCDSSKCAQCISNYKKTTISFCIICMGGYYSSYITGQCKSCPVNCQTCIQQSNGKYDKWKWDIRAFYNVFVNGNGNHPFELYSIDLKNAKFEIICISCPQGQKMHQNQCYDDCGDDCLDCQFGQESFQCLKCASTIYNIQRSTQVSNANKCLRCPDFCSACYPRTQEEIVSLNPFFSSSLYLMYSHICFEYEKKNIVDGFVSINPQYMVADYCPEFSKCSKKLTMHYFVYCDSAFLVEDMIEGYENQYQTFQDIFAQYKMNEFETTQLYAYMNRLRVIEVYYQLDFKYKQSKAICIIQESVPLLITQSLRQNVFSLKRIYLVIDGGNVPVPILLEDQLLITNFDFVQFHNFLFLVAYPTEGKWSVFNFYILNDYNSLDISFLDCKIFQEDQSIKALYGFSSNRLGKLTIINMGFAKVKIINSQIFNFQPAVTNPQSAYTIDQFRIDNSFFSNTSIFYYSAVNNSLNYIIRFSNVTIMNSVFTSSFFINSIFMYGNDIGEMTLENCYLENVTFTNNSTFLYLLSIQKLKITNLTLYNLKFLDSSSFIISNVMEINQLYILDSIINSGYFITNYGRYSSSNIVQENSKFISLTSITIQNNIYSNFNSFIYLLQNEISNLTLHLDDLVLRNNNYVFSQIGTYSFDYVSYKQTLIYIECSQCYFKDIQIYRGVGSPEISIVGSKDLKIDTLFIQLNPHYYLRSLHSSVDCVKKFIYLDVPFVLYIGIYHNVIFNNITLQDSIVIDYSFILLVGKSKMEEIQYDTIAISNSVFQNNLLLIATINRFSSIISIQTEQATTILVTNTKFINNHLNEYQEDVQLHSSTTFLLDAQLGNVVIDSSEFFQNVITNSSEAPMYIKAQSLYITNCNYSKQNILNTDVLIKNFVLPVDYHVIDMTVYKQFQILSEGGNGYLFVSKLSIVNTYIESSIAANGAGFYINSQTEGIISIVNSQFFNTTTILNGYQLSSGGLFYIDSSKSKLNLSILNSTIHQSYSRTFGGAIFIDASRLDNQIILDSLTITSVFSLQHSILSYSPSKLISVASIVLIKNSYFSNNQSEFEKFVSQISELSAQNISPFQIENPAIFTQFSNFTIMNCSFADMHLPSLIQIDFGININLLELKIHNCSIFQSPIIKLSLRENIIGLIRMENIEFVRLTEFIYSNSLQCYQITISNSQLLCPRDTALINQSPLPQQISQNLTNQQNCNLNSLYNSNSYNFSLIEIIKLEANHSIWISDIIMTEIICKVCYYGLISIQEFNASQQNFLFDNFKMINNNCGQMGCLSILKSIAEDYIYQIKLENNNKQLNIQDLNCVNEKPFQAKLTNSIFYNNTASYGGACFFANINLLINNSLFVGNDAKVEGGAIYYYSNLSHLLMANSQIVNNSAGIAGGIFLNSNQLQKTEELNLFIKQNLAVDFGDNLFETSRKLYLSLNAKDRLQTKNLISNSTTIIDQVNISPYFILGSNNKSDLLLLPSGIPISDYQFFDVNSNSYRPYNFSFRVFAVNAFDERMIKLNNTQCTLKAQTINMALQSKNNDFQINGINSSQHLSITQISFNSQTEDYNLDDLIIYFNQKIDSDKCLQLAFSCDSISIPYYDLSSISNETTRIINYILLLNLRTFQCQLGEYLNVTSGGCVLCDVSQNQYSVTINSTGCSFKDEQKMKNIEPAMIELRKTYWRAFYYSQTIELCYHLLANCQGGWLPGNPSCATGHIGALCEQCDLYSTKGEGSYSQNQSYQCSNCEKMAGNILNIVFVILWTLLSVFISVTSTIQMIDDFVVQLKLKPFGFFSIIQSASTSVLLKVFTNYLQIVSSISSFQLSIPIGITLAVRGVGNPIESMAFSLDCYLIQITDITIIYFRIIWGFLMAGIYIFLFFSMHLLLSFFKKKPLNITFITTTLIYIYIYLSPNLVSGLSALISYRNISDERWIAANVAYLYGTQQHAKWLIFFVSPAFFIVSLLLPFFFWYILYHNRQELNSSKVRKVWGYLYNEYKLSTYYWETIKILQKELIILIMIYYEDYVAIKASLIFFILLLYNRLAIEYKPYLTGDLNTIDYLSTSICSISIILASSIYTAQQFGMQEIVWPFYGILGVINFYFISQMITKLLFAYFDKLYEQIDKVKALISYRFPFLAKSNQFCFRVLSNTSGRKQLVRKRYQQIRLHLLQQAKMIITLKEQNNLEIACSQKTLEGQSNPLLTSHRTNRYTRNMSRINTQRQQIFFQTQLISNRKSEEI